MEATAFDFRCSDENNEIIKALVQFQATVPQIPKDQVMMVRGRDKPHHYASLESILHAIRKPLSEVGLAIIQPPVINGTFKLVTRLFHSSGQWFESSYPLTDASAAPHAMGSAITYGRRYSICGLLGIAPEDDDDGQTAQDRAEKQPARPAFNPERVAAPPATPTTPAAPRTKPDGTYTILDVVTKTGVAKSTGKAWERFTIMTDDGEFGTFDGGMAERARHMKENGIPAVIQFTERTNGRFVNRDITSILEAEGYGQQQQAEPTPAATLPPHASIKTDAQVIDVEFLLVQGKQAFKVVTNVGEFGTYDPTIAAELSRVKGSSDPVCFHWIEAGKGKRIVKLEEIPF